MFGYSILWDTLAKRLSSLIINIAKEDYIIRVQGCVTLYYRNQTKFLTLSELEWWNIYSLPSTGKVKNFVEGEPNYTCNFLTGRGWAKLYLNLLGGNTYWTEQIEGKPLRTLRPRYVCHCFCVVSFNKYNCECQKVLKAFNKWVYLSH